MPESFQELRQHFFIPAKQITNFSVPYHRHNKQATIIRRFALKYSSLRIKRQDN